MLSQLPTELLVRVLRELDAPSLAACARTARLFYDICQSTEIQCQLALTKFGSALVPNAPGTLRDHFDYLRQKEQNWREGKPFKVWDLPRPANLSGIYDLCGGHYILGDSNRRFIYATNLRESRPSWRTIPLEAPLVDLGVAIYEHDLLALMTYQPASLHEVHLVLHLRSFSTAQNHPEAKDPNLLVFTYSRITHFLPPQIGIEIVGDYLILVVINMTVNDGRRGALDYLYIIDWRTGRVKLHRRFKEDYWAPVVLSSKLVAFLNCRTHQLDFYPLEPAYFARYNGEWQPSPALIMAFPTLHPGSKVMYVSSRCEPNPNTQFPRGGENSGVVMQDPDHAIATFYIHILPHASVPLTVSFALYVHRSTLIEAYCDNLPLRTPLPPIDDEEILSLGVDLTSQNEELEDSLPMPGGLPVTITPPLPPAPAQLAGSLSSTIVPWEEWGQEKARILNDTYPSPINTNWITTSSGERALRYGSTGILDVVDVQGDDNDDDEEQSESDSPISDSDSSTEDNDDNEERAHTSFTRSSERTCQLEILDFSSYSVSKAKSHPSRDPDVQLFEGEAGSVVYDPMRCFLGEVTSKLPFVRRRIALPSSSSPVDEEEQSLDGILLDEENLILVNGVHEPDEDEPIKILTFAPIA